MQFICFCPKREKAGEAVVLHLFFSVLFCFTVAYYSKYSSLNKGGSSRLLLHPRRDQMM